MRLIRLILIVMISVALPFSNVAASAMLHCAQPTNASPVTPSAHTQHATQHTGEHAEHHSLQDEAAADDDGEPVFSSQNDLACSSCSYCQSCASAMAPAMSARGLKIDLSSAINIPAADPLRQSILEGPFRPPALAFA